MIGGPPRLLVVRALWAALVLACSGCGGQAPGQAPPPCDDPPARPAGLVIAGSGSNIALVRAVARRYLERHPGVRLHIGDSIGTGGAVRALGDGAIDIGLASRRLTPDEVRGGLVETSFARVALVLAVGRGVPETDITSAQVAAIFRGERRQWGDGTPVVPLLREPGDSGAALVARALPGVRAAMDEAAERRQVTVCYTDQQMRDALQETAGAVGFLDLGILRLEQLPLRPLAIDGVAPTAAEVAGGRYPLVKQLSFVTRGAPAGEALRFIEYAKSEAARDLLAAGEFVAGGAR